MYIYTYECVFANSLEDQDLITGRVIPKTQKIILDAALLNTEHYKVGIKGKVEQSRVVANEKGACGLPLTTVVRFIYFNF